MAGRVLVRVDDDTAEAGQYEAVLASAGSKHAIKNLGPDPAVLLVFVGLALPEARAPQGPARASG